MEEENSRIEQFYVPSGFIREFARLLQKNKFDNTIAGVDDDDIVIFVSYVAGEQKIIDAIKKMIEKYIDDETYGKWKLNGIRD